MAAKAEDPPALPAATPVVSSSDPRPDPAPRRALVEKREAEEDGRDEEAEREALPREPKRRRTCPAALETTCSSAAAAKATRDDDEGSNGALRGEFSFSFDTRGFAAVETTPKFGSFHFPVADLGSVEAEAAAEAVRAEVEAEAGAAEEAGDGVDEDKIRN